MSAFANIFTVPPKGLRASHQHYRPANGELCLYSGPNMDDDDGYVFMEIFVRWSDDVFVLTQKDGCWPNINKWDHCIFKPLLEATS